MTQLSFLELLEDPIFKAWVQKIPKITAVGRQPPWRVWAVRERKWIKVDFPKYSQAYNFIVRRLGEFDDCTIHSKRQEFKPPVVKYQGKRRYWPMPPQHRWCGYCRRPVQMRFFSKHHALPDYLVIPYQRHCPMCGGREEAMKHYETPIRSRWA